MNRAEKIRFSESIFYSVINSLVTLLFPIIVYPYVSRVLQPEGVGLYNLAYGVLEYFILFANLGVPLLGTRVVAKYKNDPNEMRERCGNIFYINLITTLVAFVAFVLFAWFSPGIKEHFVLYFVVGFQILSFCLNVEWYYQGIENFKYIAIRNLIIKVICIVCIYIFVNTKDDVMIYAMIMMFSTFGYSIINFLKFVKDTKMKMSFKGTKALFKSILVGFFIYAASKINTNADVVMLGFMTGEVGQFNVGIYTNATKIINMIISIIIAVNLVIMPRITAMLKDDENGAMKVLNKLFGIVFIMSLTMAVGLYFVAEEVILVFSGELYAESVLTMRIMCVNICLIAFSNFFGVQVLYSKNKEKYTATAVLIGASVNIIINALLIPKMLYNGAAIATIISNAVIVLIEYLFSVKVTKSWFYSKNIIKAIIASIIMGAALVAFGLFVKIENTFLLLVLKVSVGVITFALMGMLLWKNDLIKIYSIAKKGAVMLIKKIYSKFMTWYCLRHIANKGTGCIVNKRSKFSRNVKMGNNCNFNGAKMYGNGEICIGNNFHSGENLVLLTTNHNYEGKMIPYDDTFIDKDIVIEDNVWIGYGVTILGGSHICEGAIIQAGSVVVGKIEKCGIAGGAPAKVFKYRDKEHYEKLKLEKKFF